MVLKWCLSLVPQVTQVRVQTLAKNGNANIVYLSLEWILED